MKNIKRVKVANIYFKRSIYDKEDPILIWSQDKVKMIMAIKRLIKAEKERLLNVKRMLEVINDG